MKEEPMQRLLSLTSYLPKRLYDEYCRAVQSPASPLNEIRLRAGKPVVLMRQEGYTIIGKQTPLSQTELTEVFEKLCDYSVYSHQAELAQGFVTLPGGHRAGICGTAAADKNGCRTVKYISSVNIRVAGEYIGCADEILQALLKDGLRGALLAGPPCCGKTTALRDVALSLSSPEYRRKVVMVDERGELAAIYQGVPQHTVGLFCDVLNGYPKGEGILQAVRTLAPDVIICDEIGGEGEAEAVCEGVNAGVAVIAAIHAGNAEELYQKPSFRRLLATGAFAKIAFLKGGSSRCELDCVREVKPSCC